MSTADAVKLLNVVALATLMFSIGLNVSLDEIGGALRRVRLVAAAIIANFVGVPLITIGVLYLFQATPLVVFGFLILAVCPGAPVGPSFVAIAKGDVPLATGLMVVLAGLSAILAPAYLTAAIRVVPMENSLNFDYRTVAKILLGAQLAPLIAGLCLRASKPAVSAKLAKPFTSVANVLLLVLVAVILATQMETLLAIRLRAWLGMLQLWAGGLAIGWLSGGREPATRRAMLITTGVRNVAVGLAIASANFLGTPAVTAVVAYGLFSTLGAAAIALALRRR